MKSDFRFSNLLGTVYRQGNILFSEDGTQLISPVGNRVSVFDLVHNKSFTFEYEHRKNISCVALNPQGTLLLSVDEDGRAILVNFRAKTVLHHLNFKEKVRDLKFSPDGKLFALACGRFVQVWKTPEVAEDRQFAPFVRYRVHAGHFSDIISLTWSQDSRFLVSTSKDLTARIWSLDSEEKDLASVTFAGHRDYVMGAFFSSDQERIYTVSKDGAVFQWEYTIRPGYEALEEEPDAEIDPSLYSWRITKKNYFYASQARVKCVTFHAKSNMLIVGFNNGEFRLYELPDFTLLQQLSMGQNAVNAVSVNNTGEWLAFGSSKLGQLLVYEWQSESYILKQQGHFDATNAVTYSPDGSRVVTASEDGKIKIWDVVSGFCLVTFQEHTAAVSGLAFAKKGQVLFSASLDGTVRAWDLVRYRNFRTFTAAERIQFNCLAADPSGEVVCAGSVDSFAIHVWSVQTGQLVETLDGHEGPVSCLSFSRENSVLASASWDKTIRIWSIFGRSQQVEPLEVYADVLSIAVRPDGNEVAASTLDGQVLFFDINEGKQVSAIDGKKDIVSGRHLEDRFTAKNSARSKYFTTIDYSFDGLSIVAGGNNNSICLYDIPNSVLLKRFIVSRNMSLNGTQQFLNSKKMTEAGSLDLIDRDAENSDLEDRIDNTLPGSSRGGDLSTRRVRPAIRITGLKFSPTSNAFAAASTEGILIYSVDDSLIFDPFDLDIDITPQAVIETLQEKEYLHALVMAFRLNEEYLINRVYETVPLKNIELVSSGLPVVYLARMLKFIGDFAMDSQHLEFNLIWIKAILSAHGHYISSHKNEFGSCLRSVQRFIARIAKDVVAASKDNKYAYFFLTSTDGSIEGGASDEEGQNHLNVSDSEGEAEGSGDEVLSGASDDEEGWIGFTDTKNNLPLQLEEDSDEDLI
ncbi:LAQU0S09e03004g1_1 [Lachancea quebecensis]|uniref:LAQU0S09e03004g1_1 n=1 Tax=Lachancea quebecensis TaxID=1654605 RepID=A0A0P1KTY1_9SACH|nr:LAQU0S09e03004g1_1 [Lachancea quebecensis]